MIQTPPVVAVLGDEPQVSKGLRRLLATHCSRVEACELGNDFLATLSSHLADCLVRDTAKGREVAPLTPSQRPAITYGKRFSLSPEKSIKLHRSP